jgi:hypothetical protein
MVTVSILPEKNVIDDGFLDLIGREFTSHEQGLAEWIKNSADAIRAAGLPSRLEIIFLRLTDGENGMPPVFECVDFVGMTLKTIETGFKPWGRLSGRCEWPGSYGGYGIGGKFYMRQMFASSDLITYCQGYLNIFGFDANHAYGYGEGYRNRPMSPGEALRLADIDPLASMGGMRDAIISGRRGFSVFRGLWPKGVGQRIDVETLCQRLRHHPQAQNPLKWHRIGLIHNGVLAIERLQPRSVPRRPGFERPWVEEIPATLPRVDGTKGEVLHLSENAGSPGTLRLFVSSESLEREGKMASLNRIDFLGEDGVVGSYRIDELEVDVPYGESIFGQCRLSKMTGWAEHYGKKTRDELVDNPENRALLRWVGSQVRRFSDRIRSRVSEQERKIGHTRI